MGCWPLVKKRAPYHLPPHRAGQCNSCGSASALCFSRCRSCSGLPCSEPKALFTTTTSYYNYEAVRWHQVVWLVEAWHLPLSAFLSLVGDKLAEYAHSWQLMRWWLLVAGALYAATRWHQAKEARPLLPAATGPALAWVTGSFVLFFGLLGYYPDRLTYTLLPLALCLVAGLLPHWPSRYARPPTLAVAAGWHLYVLLSYGPFS